MYIYICNNNDDNNNNSNNTSNNNNSNNNNHYIYIYVYIHTYIIGIHPYIRWNDVYVPYTAAQAPWLQSVAKSLLPGSDAYIPVKLGAKDAKDVVSGDPSTC